jgi:hypothetical protein
MALPNGAGGYQVGDGNLGELVLGYQAAPLSVAATATLTAAQVTAGILLVGAGATAAQTYTLPAASTIDAILTSAKVGSTFDLYVVNTGTSSGTGALAMGSGTGFSDGGNATVALAITSSGLFRFRKTAENAYSVYRVA